MVPKRRLLTRSGLTHKQWCQQSRRLTRNAIEAAKRDFTDYYNERKRKAAEIQRGETFRTAKKKMKNVHRTDLRAILEAEAEQCHADTVASRATTRKGRHDRILLQGLKSTPKTSQSTEWLDATSEGSRMDFPAAAKRQRKTFGGKNSRSRRARSTFANSKQLPTVKLTIPPGQFWAVVEGVAVLDGDENPTSYLQQLLMEGNSDLLPEQGRVLELLPLECMAGQWTAQLHSQRPLGLLRDSAGDWSDKRIMIRHQSHDFLGALSSKQRTFKGYFITAVDPSSQRQTAMESQGIDTKTPGFILSLSLVAFDGFSSSYESHQYAQEVADTVSSSCGEHSCWTKQTKKKGIAVVPDLLSVPPFEAHTSQTSGATICGAGGLSILGCFVDDLQKQLSTMDYKIFLVCHETSNTVVGLDVVFASSQSLDLEISPSTISPDGVGVSKAKKMPLTRQNLTKHSTSLDVSNRRMGNPADKEKTLAVLEPTFGTEQPRSPSTSSTNEMPMPFHESDEEDVTLYDSSETTEGATGATLTQDVGIAGDDASANNPAEGVAAAAATVVLARKLDFERDDDSGKNPTEGSAEFFLRDDSVASSLHRKTGRVSFESNLRTVPTDSLQFLSTLPRSTAVKPKRPQLARTTCKKSTVMPLITPTPNAVPPGVANENRLLVSAETPYVAGKEVSRCLFSSGSSALAIPQTAEIVTSTTTTTTFQRVAGAFQEMLPLIHHVFYGVDSGHNEASLEELIAFDPLALDNGPTGGTITNAIAWCNTLFDDTTESEEEEDDDSVDQDCMPSIHDVFYGVHDEMECPEATSDELCNVLVSFASPSTRPTNLWSCFVAFCDDLVAADDDEYIVILEPNATASICIWQFLQAGLTLLFFSPVLYWILNLMDSFEPEASVEVSPSWYTHASDWYSWATEPTASSPGYRLPSTVG